MKVLIIDDDQATLDFLNTYLKLEGRKSEFTLCNTASDGFGHLLSGNFDYAFIDYRLDHDLTAGSLINGIKEKGFKTKIYIVSGFDKSKINPEIELIKDMVAGIIPKLEFFEELNNLGLTT